MGSTVRLDAYLALERAMLALDAAGDEAAELLRDAMDPLWITMSEENIGYLNARTEKGAAFRPPTSFATDIYVPFRQADDDTGVILESSGCREFTNCYCDAA